MTDRLRAILVVALWGAACREAAVDAQELAEAESRWRGHGIESYDIVVVVSGEGFDRRVRVSVRDGAVAEAEVTEHGLTRKLNETEARPYTVEGLFRTLREELGSGRRFVRVWFDPEDDFPQHMELGPRRKGAGVLLLKVERFEARSGAAH